VKLAPAKKAPRVQRHRQEAGRVRRHGQDAGRSGRPMEREATATRTIPAARPMTGTPPWRSLERRRAGPETARERMIQRNPSGPRGDSGAA
jgi:hypothetical protein